MTITHAFKVHVGYTRKGNARYRRFITLNEATAYCQRVFRVSGVVLSVIAS